MGDRGNVRVISAWHPEHDVFLYTHSFGTELPDIVMRALDRGRGRWGDTDYLTRIIFSEMLLASVSPGWATERDVLLQETGFGIGRVEVDPNHPLITVNDEQRTVTCEGVERSYEDFIASRKRVDA